MITIEHAINLKIKDISTQKSVQCGAKLQQCHCVCEHRTDWLYSVWQQIDAAEIRSVRVYGMCWNSEREFAERKAEDSVRNQ